MSDRERQLELTREYAIREGLAVAWTDGLEGEDAARSSRKWGDAPRVPREVENPGAAGAYRGEFDTRARKRNPVAGSGPSRKVFVDADGAAAVELVRSLDLPNTVEVVSGGEGEKRHFHFDPPEDWSGPSAFLFEVDEATSEVTTEAKSGAGQYLRLPGSTHRKGGEVARFATDDVPPVARLSTDDLERLCAAAGYGGTSANGSAAPVGEAELLRDGRKRHGRDAAMILARYLCADPDGIAAMLEAGAPFMYASKDGSPLEADKELRRALRQSARTAARKGDARLTRDRAAKERALAELEEAMNGETTERMKDAESAATDYQKRFAGTKIDLVRMHVEGIPEVEWFPGLEGILARGGHTVIGAQYKRGKTFLLMLMAIELALQGFDVMIVDLENGRLQYARRFDAIAKAWDLSADQLATVARHLHYYEFPPIAKVDAEEFAKLASSMDVVCFDSLPYLLEQVIEAENDNVGLATLGRIITHPLTRAGVAQLYADNLGHDDTKLRGASQKGGLFETIILVKGNAFSSDRAEILELKVERTRNDYVGSVEYQMGAGTFRRLVDGERVPDEVRDAVIAILRRAAEPGGSGGLGVRELMARLRESGVKLDNSKTSTWFTMLERDSAIPVSRVEGKLVYVGP